MYSCTVLRIKYVQKHNKKKRNADCFIYIAGILMRQDAIEKRGSEIMPYSYETLKSALAQVGISEPGEEAMLLLTAFCHVDRAGLYCDRAKIYDVPALDAAVEKRMTRFPLQYILGQWDFFGLTFRVDPHCLIPRPDTEILVEEAVRSLPQGSLTADLCTGSGCVGVSLLSARPDVVCAALELYPDTLTIACDNARRLHVDSRFLPVCADLLTDGPERLRETLHTYARGETNRKEEREQPLLDAILSNPPYIRRTELDGLAPELGYEPAAALDGGEDGLTFYRAILRRYRPLMKDGGQLLLEIGCDQADEVRELASQAGGWDCMAVHRDLGGHDRVISLRAVP